MAWDWDQIKSAKTAAREYADIVMDRAWATRLGEAQMRMAVLEEQLSRRPSDTSLKLDVEELAIDIEALSAEKDSKVCRFVFKGISADRYERIVAACPPTSDQRKRAAAAGRSVAFDEDRFPRELVKACLVEPRLTSAQVDELWEPGSDDDEDADDAPAGAKWTSAELAALFQAAQLANVSRPRAE